MDKKLQHIIRQGKSEKVEFKSAFHDDVIVTLVAFANSKGGRVYVGIHDDGTIKGAQIGKETIQKWMNEIKSKTQPSIIPTIEVLYMDKK